MGVGIINMGGWIPTPPDELEEFNQQQYESQGAAFYSDLPQKETWQNQIVNLAQAAIQVSGKDLFALEPQDGPDCTSHFARNAWDICRAIDILDGQLESWETRGATELIYGHRNATRGMNVTRAVKLLNEFGNLIRKDYGFVNLKHYQFRIGENWRRRVPKQAYDAASANPAMHCYRLKSVEEACDAMANGYAVGGGSRYGNDGRRDKNGMSRWNRSWNHAMCWGGFDAKDLHAVMILQSWGLWNTGGHPPWGKLPGGAFLAPFEDADKMIKSGEFYAIGQVKGLPPKKLPNYGASGFL